MKTPVLIISGFLGSGKTTLLLQLLREIQQRGLRPAILMNELGKQDVDGLILSEALDGLPLEKLLDGCICCSKKSEISGALQNLLALRPAPDLLVIELTGVANPEEVVDAMADPELRHSVVLDKIITVLDAEHALEYNSIFSTDKELVHTLRRQIDVADVMIINKTDLVDSAHLIKVTKLVEKHNPNAPQLPAVNAKIDFELLLHGFQPLQHANANQEAPAPNRLKVLASHSHGHKSHSRIQSIFIPIPEQASFSEKKLEKFLKHREGRVLRAKGYLCLNGSPHASLIQFAGKRLQIESSPYRGPHYLVVIGYELDEARLLEEWRIVC
ncbi:MULTISPECIES: CobW family GTP-binding protein [Paenibacillus]|uniref:CobW family GTP-binding protein n=1 Tax=Paenibacillus TaxID=44249 RepID=UPI002FE15DD7